MESSEHKTTNLESETSPNESNKYDFYLLIYNIQSKHNAGTLIRSASAFNCKKILVLGQNKKILKRFFGHQGTLKRMEFLFFDTIDDLKKFCRENKIFICGVEIGEQSVAINKQPFQGNTLFVLGNEGSGMNQKQKDLCDQLVYIPQYSNKTGSLNVAIAGSIIFHHFALWAGYKEADYTNEKYNVMKGGINTSNMGEDKDLFNQDNDHDQDNNSKEDNYVENN